MLSGILWKRVLDHGVASHKLILLRAICSLGVLSVLWGITKYFDIELLDTLGNTPSASMLDYVWAVAIGLLSFWGLYAYSGALTKGRYSFVASLAAISTTVSMVASVLIHGELPTAMQVCAASCIICGLIYHQRAAIREQSFSKELAWTLLCNLLWGVSFVLYAIPIRQLGSFRFTLILECCVLVSAGLLSCFNMSTPPLRSLTSANIAACAVVGVLVAAGSLLSNIALGQISVLLNILIGFVFEVLVLIVGWMVFKESLTKDDWVLIVITSIAGLMFMA